MGFIVACLRKGNTNECMRKRYYATKKKIKYEKVSEKLFFKTQLFCFHFKLNKIIKNAS